MSFQNAGYLKMELALIRLNPPSLKATHSANQTYDIWELVIRRKVVPNQQKIEFGMIRRDLMRGI